MLTERSPIGRRWRKILAAEWAGASCAFEEEQHVAHVVSEAAVGEFAVAAVGQPAVVFFNRALFAVVVAGVGDSVSPLDGSVAPVGRWRCARGFFGAARRGPSTVAAVKPRSTGISI
ncbi:hypothetical protein AWC27_27530 [Mycobacterium szulgai]|uniref:Uncharacterized protein n=1 Tax=Mycobacterium szulgai TaxID=1787 RepID=A0A1X2EJD2_MYCSZ|nr:hypothetical protein AWC27_27530 [Mycobacterium szulgai]